MHIFRRFRGKEFPYSTTRLHITYAGHKSSIHHTRHQTRRDRISCHKTSTPPRLTTPCYQRNDRTQLLLINLIFNKLLKKKNSNSHVPREMIFPFELALGQTPMRLRRSTSGLNPCASGEHSLIHGPTQVNAFCGDLESDQRYLNVPVTCAQ